MSEVGDWISQPACRIQVAARADVVVVGGGPAGLSAALASARNGASVILLERYNHLGGLASGGMVLVLDDMWDNHLHEISVRGTALTFIERIEALGLAAFPRSDEWGTDPAALARWTRWGAFDFHSHTKPHPICFAAAFDPDAWKRVALEMVSPDYFATLGIPLEAGRGFTDRDTAEAPEVAVASADLVRAVGRSLIGAHLMDPFGPHHRPPQIVGERMNARGDEYEYAVSFRGLVHSQMRERLLRSGDRVFGFLAADEDANLAARFRLRLADGFDDGVVLKLA